MVIRETRAFQLHAGKDLYPLVGRYLGDILAERIDTVRNLAMVNRILVQAEAEGKEYIEGVLKAAGRANVKVTFGDEASDNEVIRFNADRRKMFSVPSRKHTRARLERSIVWFYSNAGISMNDQVSYTLKVWDTWPGVTSSDCDIKPYFCRLIKK